MLYGLRFSPDGRRLIAGDYPGGVVVVWDVATGKQLTRINTGSGYHLSHGDFSLTPDWQTLYVRRQRHKVTRFEKDGKKLLRWDMDGDVRAWDLATGELRETFAHDPPRGVMGMVLSPDGTTFATFEQLTGESEDGAATAASLWDVKARKWQPLPANLNYWAVYTPDAKTLAAPARSQDGRTNTIELIDVMAAKKKVSIPVGPRDAALGFLAVSPDGKLLVAEVSAKTGDWLKLWDPATGRAAGSFEGDKEDWFLWMAFCPGGHTLAVTNSSPKQGQQGKLFLFDLPSRKLVKRILLGEKATVSRPVFSPDGKWIAVPTQVFPESLLARVSRPEESAQPRIHLVEVASGRLCETLIAPQGITASVCFSPDGKTLATGGNGRVLLWDLTKPPLGSEAPRP